MHNLSPRERIYQKALNFLSRREYSAQELRSKLMQRFAEYAEEIPGVIADLKEKKYLSDERYAAMMTRHRASQAYGPNYVKQELKSHQALVNEPSFHDDETMDAFFQGWLRKFKSRFKTLPENSLEQAKMMKYFLQRGYSHTQLKDYLERLRLNDV